MLGIYIALIFYILLTLLLSIYFKVNYIYIFLITIVLLFILPFIVIANAKSILKDNPAAVFIPMFIGVILWIYIYANIFVLPLYYLYYMTIGRNKTNNSTRNNI